MVAHDCWLALRVTKCNQFRGCEVSAHAVLSFVQFVEGCRGAGALRKRVMVVGPTSFVLRRGEPTGPSDAIGASHLGSGVLTTHAKVLNPLATRSLPSWFGDSDVVRDDA